MNAVKRILALVAVGGLGVAGVALVQHVDRSRQYQHLLATGERALQAGNSYAAVEAFSGALALRPDSMAAYYQRGEAYRVQRHDDEAIRDLREALRLAPDATQPRIALGQIYDARGDYLRAADWYSQAADRLKDEDPALLYALALARYRAGEPAEAIDPLERAIARNGSVGEAHYLLGVVYRDTNNPRAAEAALEQAVRVAPLLIPAHEELADLYRSEGQFVDEMAQLQALATLDQRRARQIAIAVAQSDRGQFDAALDTLSEVAAARPDDSRVALAEGRIYLARAERTLDHAAAVHALDALGKALAGTARRSEGLALFGRALFLSGDPAAAERMLREAVATSPVDPEAFAYLADASERLSHDLEARNALLSLDALQGDTVPASARLATVRRIGALSLRARDPKLALRYLTDAVQGGDEDAPTLGLLAQARWQTGDTRGAVDALSRALALEPRDPDLVRLARTIK
jgi:tetratricopeptide (TPR) repeat protein